MVSDYDEGWDAWIAGEQFPPKDASKEWQQGFYECAQEYPPEDEA